MLDPHNTEYICQKGYERLWMLRRLKGLGASEVEMMYIWNRVNQYYNWLCLFGNQPWQRRRQGKLNVFRDAHCILSWVRVTLVMTMHSTNWSVRIWMKGGSNYVEILPKNHWQIQDTTSGSLPIMHLLITLTPDMRLQKFRQCLTLWWQGPIDSRNPLYLT